MTDSLHHLTYFLYPFSFEQDHFKKINRMISKDDVWRPVNSHYLSMMTRQLVFNLSNFLKNEDLSRIYECDSNIIANQLFSAVALEFRPGELYIPFRVEKAFLVLSFNGVGFIILKVRVESVENTKDAVLKFNGSFDIVEPVLEDKENFFLGMPRKIIHRKFQSDCAANYFCPNNRITADNLADFSKALKNGQYFYVRDVLNLLIGGNKYFRSAFECDGLECLKLLKLSVCMEDEYDAGFSERLPSFRTVFDEPDTILEAEKRYKPFENTEFYFTLEGGTVYIASRETKLSKALFNSADQFLYIMLVCFVQKMAFSRIFSEICVLSTDIKKKRLRSNQIINRINKTNLFFINTFSILRFNYVSDNTVLNACYRFWQRGLGLEKDYEEVKNKLELFNVYMERRNQRRFNLFSDAITCIFFPLTIVAALLGMNVKELGEGYPLSLRSVIVLDMIGVAFLFILVIRIWIYLTDRDRR